jgi:hypothetical protein
MATMNVINPSNLPSPEYITSRVKFTEISSNNLMEPNNSMSLKILDDKMEVDTEMLTELPNIKTLLANEIKKMNQAFLRSCTFLTGLGDYQ